jgi:hypothetical protein
LIDGDGNFKKFKKDNLEQKMNAPMETKAEATKHDKGKPRMDLIEPTMLIALGTILRFGAEKYGDSNWKAGKGQDSMRIYASIQRHLVAWRAGENLDEESGKPHLWHVATELMFLIYFQDTNTGVDSRP